MKKFICFLILCLSVNFSLAQRFTLKGKLVTDSIPESTINIVNITSGAGSISDANNEFSIKVSVDDELIFSSVQYKNVLIKISEAHKENPFIEIVLEEEVNQLEEVRIPNLSGNLASDINSLPVFDKYKYNAPMSVVTPLTREEKLLYTATTGPGGTRFKWYSLLFGSAPLDPVFNSISGRTKMLKQLNATSKELKLIEDEVLNRHHFLTTSCKLEKDQIYLFLNYCLSKPNFRNLLQDNNKLELFEFYKKESSQFKELMMQQDGEREK